MINYAKLWVFLNSRGMKRTDLLEIISSPTLAKLGKNENVSVEIIGKICDFLDCQPSDIMENVKREEIIKAGQELNQKLNDLFDMISIATGKSPDELLDDFNKEAPIFLEKLKKGNRDFVGLQEFIDKTKDDKK